MPPINAVCWCGRVQQGPQEGLWYAVKWREERKNLGRTLLHLVGLAIPILLPVSIAAEASAAMAARRDKVSWACDGCLKQVARASWWLFWGRAFWLGLVVLSLALWVVVSWPLLEGNELPMDMFLLFICTTLGILVAIAGGGGVYAWGFRHWCRDLLRIYPNFVRMHTLPAIVSPVTAYPDGRVEGADGTVAR